MQAVPQPGLTKHQPRECEWPTCHVIYTPGPRTKGKPPQRFCSKSCATRARNAARYGSADPQHFIADRATRALAKARKRRLALNAAGYDGVTDDEIRDRDCWLCQLPVCLYGSRRIYRNRKYPDGRSPSIDHIVPISHGGSDTALNKRAAHLACNASRGNTPDDQGIIDFGADLDARPKRDRRPRYCDTCGERVTARRCPLHDPVRICTCGKVIKNARTNSTTCASCIVAQRSKPKRPRNPACRVPGCNAKGTFGRGCCAPHYHRLKRYGDVFADVPLAQTRRERLAVAATVRAK